MTIFAKKLHLRCSTGLKMGFWLRVWNNFPVYKLTRKNTQPENMCDIVFDKAKRSWWYSKQNECLCRSSRPKGSLNKMFWEISLNSQGNVCAGIFLVFSCDFCEICKNNIFAEQHRTTASDYNSINFFFYQGFLSRALTTHRTAERNGGVGDHLLFHSTTFTRSRIFRHLLATLHVRWLSILLIASLVFTRLLATRWGFYHLIELPFDWLIMWL